MKKKIIFIGLFLAFLSLNAQPSYFYYYGGEKQYLELNTKHAFVSVADENAAIAFILNNTKHKPFRIDISEGDHSKTTHQRFWTELSFDE